VGDWNVDRQRFPQGLKPFRDRVHAAGMLWGLWMDAERVGDQSRIAKEHPEWLAMNYEGERKMGGMLDLTNPEVAKWMESQIARVIEENQLEFFRRTTTRTQASESRRSMTGSAKTGTGATTRRCIESTTACAPAFRTLSSKTAPVEAGAPTSAWCDASVIPGSPTGRLPRGPS